VFYYCFYFLQFITGDEYAVGNQPPRPARALSSSPPPGAGQTQAVLAAAAAGAESLDGSAPQEAAAAEAVGVTDEVTAGELPLVVPPQPDVPADAAAAAVAAAAAAPPARRSLLTSQLRAAMESTPAASVVAIGSPMPSPPQRGTLSAPTSPRGMPVPLHDRSRGSADTADIGSPEVVHHSQTLLSSSLTVLPLPGGKLAAAVRVQCGQHTRTGLVAAHAAVRHLARISPGPSRARA
jgi:hypothetical protein